MSIALAPQYTQRHYRWTDWKTVKTAKALVYQYDDDGTTYTIYGYDGPEVHICQIFKGVVPYAIINTGYSQSQNDSDKSDFETNFLSAANAPLNITYLTGHTDGTKIGNTSDRLKVDASVSSTSSSNTAYISRVDASGAKTTSGNTGTLDAAGFGCLSYAVQISATSGTNNTLQISVETSEDGTNWEEITNTKKFITTGAQNHDNIAIGTHYYRYSWVITGTTPSFTFTICSTLKDYLPRRNVTIDKYGDIAINTLNATSTVFQSADCSNISLSTVRSDDGGSTTQYKIQASNNSTNWVDVSGAISQGRATTQLNQFSNVSFRYFRIIITAAANVANTLDLYWSAGG